MEASVSEGVRGFQRTASAQLTGDALQGLQGFCTPCKNLLRRVTAGLR
jgi:hypothetical protein